MIFKKCDICNGPLVLEEYQTYNEDGLPVHIQCLEELEEEEQEYIDMMNFIGSE